MSYVSEGNSLPRGKHSGALSCSLRRLPSSRRSGAARKAAQARVADAERAAEGLTRLPGEAGLTRTLAIERAPATATAWAICLIDTPSAFAETRAQARSRSACSSRHAARVTRASNCRR